MPRRPWSSACCESVLVPWRSPWKLAAAHGNVATLQLLLQYASNDDDDKTQQELHKTPDVHRKLPWHCCTTFVPSLAALDGLGHDCQNLVEYHSERFDALAHCGKFTHAQYNEDDEAVLQSILGDLMDRDPHTVSFCRRLRQGRTGQDGLLDSKPIPRWCTYETETRSGCLVDTPGSLVAS